MHNKLAHNEEGKNNIRKPINRAGFTFKWLWGKGICLMDNLHMNTVCTCINYVNMYMLIRYSQCCINERTLR